MLMDVYANLTEYLHAKFGHLLEDKAHGEAADDQSCGVDPAACVQWLFDVLCYPVAVWPSVVAQWRA